MDPKVESALRYACDQLGINVDSLLFVVRENLGNARLHPATKVRKSKGS